MRRYALITVALLVALCPVFPEAQDLTLPLRENSVRFAVIGDSGTGDRAQYETAKQLIAYWAKFPFTFVIMLGDNIYGSERPQDFRAKFETPYAPLLSGKVEFYASLGNHDDQNQRFYKPFNMNGERYYTFKKGGVRFFVMDSNYMDPAQVQWLDKELQASGSDWKIPYFHHPLYSSGMHGSQVELRKIVEPLFLKYGVDAVFAGHEHFYERLKPQKGIQYFTSGGAAKLRDGDIANLGMTAVGFDTDLSFMLVEVAEDELFFQTISRLGRTVDKGSFRRREMQPQTRSGGAPAPATTEKPAATAKPALPATPAGAR
jgi:predicted phosphodiesterase